MATKKPAKSSAKAISPLLFKVEWIFDPGPEIFRINRVAQQQLNKMKADFAKRANEVINKARG